jgi:hypothetical protein
MAIPVWALAVSAHGVAQAELVEQRWTQIDDEAPYRRHEVTGQRFGLRHALVQPLRRRRAKKIETERQCRQHLTDLVVQFAREHTTFAFLHLDEASRHCRQLAGALTQRLE